MLSRVAQNIYWMARYVERAEDTARIINVNTNLLLDLPRHTPFGWEPLLFIIGNEAKFFERYKQPEEATVIRYLLGDRDNPGSILSALSYARENLRTTRDVVPREAWEQINDLFLYVRDHLEMGISQRGRYEFLKRIIFGAQQITGLLSGTMTHSVAYDFLRLGCNLERADMTTRILDVRSGNLLPARSLLVQMQAAPDAAQMQASENDHPAELNTFENIQWMSVLKSMSAYQMYRQQVRLRVRGPDVLKFLLQDPAFPRAVFYCVIEVERRVGKLPKNTGVLAAIAELKQTLTEAKVPELATAGLHEFMDELQVELGRIHEELEIAYFAR